MSLRESLGRLKSHLIPLAAILLGSAIVFVWFRGYILYQWDETFPFNPIAVARSYFWPWSDLVSTGVPLVSSKDMSFVGLVFVFHDILGLSLVESQMALYYTLFGTGGVSMYYFFVSQKRANLASTTMLRFGGVVAATIYMFNPYWMIYAWQIFSEEAFLYASLPLLLVFFQKGLYSSNIKGEITAIFSVAVVSVLASPALGIPSFSIALLIGLLVLYLLWLLDPRSSGKRRGSLRFVGLCGLAAFAANLWWIYPESLLFESQLVRNGGSLSYAAGLGDLLSNSMNSNYFNVLRMVGMPAFYRTDVYPHYQFSWVYQASFVPLTLVSLGLVLTAFIALVNKGSTVSRASILFAALCVLGVAPIVSGIQPPFGTVFEQISIAAPALSTLFRDPYQKFGFWLPFGYAFLTGAACTILARIIERIQSSNHKFGKLTFPRSPGGWIVPLSLLTLLIGPVYAWPMLTGDVIPDASTFVPSGRVQIPQYYHDASSWLRSQIGNFRVLSLPQDQILQSSNWSSGYAGQDILRFLTGASIISTDPQIPNLTDFQHGLYQYIYNGGGNLTRLLGLLSVRFVLLRTDAGFYPAVTHYANITFVQSYLESQPGLILAKQFGSLFFFENTMPTADAEMFASYEIIQPSSANRIGWNISNYKGGWDLASAKFAQNASEISLSVSPQGTYAYGSVATSEDLNISILAFPYVNVRFYTSSNAALLLRVELENQSSVWVTAVETGISQIFDGNHYSSISPTTITYDISSIPGTIRNLEIYVTNSPNTSSRFNATVAIQRLTFESFLGLPRDYIRTVAANNRDPTSYAIADYAGTMWNQSTYPNTKVKISYDKVSPVEYDVKIINATSPFILVLGESFDSLWQLTFEGQTVTPTHLVVDGFANGWIISRQGNFKIVVHFGALNSFIVAAYVSLVSISGLLAITVVGEILRRNASKRRENPAVIGSSPEKT